MPKAEKGTPKYLANKMKAKGLQKLRWYCQMCQKQCRDENGFKCHTTSESHQRQLLLFGENPNRYLDEFSKEFADGYIELLRRRFGTKRVFANKVYQEYISHKEHLHMNATKWMSLTGFVKWLGKEGKCIVEETEKGWFITYIDRDPETIARQEAAAKKVKMDKDDEERMLDFIEKQVERVKDSTTTDTEAQPTELIRENEEEKIVVKLSGKLAETKPALNVKPLVASSSVFKVPKDKDKWETSSSYSSKSTKSSSGDKRKSALEEIREEEERRKRRRYNKPNWIAEGIIVKIITKQLGDKYYNEKGRVVSLVNQFCAIVKMLETGQKIKLDQAHVETVIPAPGNSILFVNGEHRESEGVLSSIDTKNCTVDVVITAGPSKGKTVRDISFDHVCKLALNKT